MGRTFTDFSQLSKGMFRKSEPVVEVKPIPKETSAGGDDALAYFGLTGREKRESGRAGAVGGCGESCAVAGNDATAALEANLEAVRAESAVLRALLQIVDTSLPGVAATRPNTALALWGRARPAGHPAARIAA